MIRERNIRLVGAAVWLFAAGESGAAQCALAWLVRHRRAAALTLQRVEGRTHPVFGAGSWQAACRSLLATNQPPAVRICRTAEDARAAAWATLVLTGDVADPIDGATAFHHHLDAPGWAAAQSPVALIGPYFFYRERDWAAAAPGSANLKHVRAMDFSDT